MALAAPRRLSPAEKKKARDRRNELRRRRYTQAREQTRPLDEIDLDSVVDTIIDRMRNKYGVYTVEELDELERRPMQGKGRRLASEGGEPPIQDWIATRRRRMEEGVRALPPFDPEDVAGGGGRRQHRPRRKLKKLRGGGTTYKSEAGDPELEALRSRVEQMGAFLDEFFGPEGEPAYETQSSTEAGQPIFEPGETARRRLDEAQQRWERETRENMTDAELQEGRELLTSASQYYQDRGEEIPSSYRAGLVDIDNEIRRRVGEQYTPAERAQLQQAELERPRRARHGRLTEEQVRRYEEEGPLHPGLEPEEEAMRRADTPYGAPEPRPRRHREEMTEEEIEGFNQYMADLREGTLRSEREEMELPSRDPRLIEAPREYRPDVPESEHERLIETARERGLEHGAAAGSWFLPDNADDATLERIARGIGEGDPEILDQLPEPPNGEWADDYNIFEDLGVRPGTFREEGDPLAGDLGMEFQQAFTEGAMNQISQELRERGFAPEQYEPTDEEFTQAREQFYPHPGLAELEQATPEDVDEVLRRSLEEGLGGETQASVGGIAPVRPRRYTSRAEGGEAPPAEEEPEITPEQLMEMVRLALAGHLMGGTVMRSAPLPEQPPLPPMPPPGPQPPNITPELDPELLKILLGPIVSREKPPEPVLPPMPLPGPQEPNVFPDLNPELLKLLLGPIIAQGRR